MLMASLRFDVTRKLDRDMFQHVTYVANRSLAILRDEGISWESSEKISKYMWRLFRVTQAYNAKNRDVTLDEIISIVTEFKSVFTGS
jgi:hypothetical protein